MSQNLRQAHDGLNLSTMHHHHGEVRIAARHHTIRRWLGFSAAALLIPALVACNGEPGGEPSPTPSYDHTSVPSTDPEGQQFSFDDAATVPEGLALQVNEVESREADSEIRGAEGTDGNIVVATIMITNNSEEPFPATQVQVWGFYGVVGAPKVTDGAGTLGDSFTGEVQPGESVVASIGWAIPADRMDEVTIMIDDNVEGHSPVRFTGEVE